MSGTLTLKGGQAALMSIGADGTLSVVSKAQIGALPEGIAFSPKSDYVYIGNYIDKNLQTFHIVGGEAGSGWNDGAAWATGVDTGTGEVAADGRRSAFTNGGAAVQLHPEFGPAADHALRWEMLGCAPLRIIGPDVDVVVRSLKRRAHELGGTRSAKRRIGPRAQTG